MFSYLMLHSTHSLIACFSIRHCHHFLSTNIPLIFHCVITPCSFFRSNFKLVFLQHIAKLYLALPLQQRFIYFIVMRIFGEQLYIPNHKL